MKYYFHSLGLLILVIAFTFLLPTTLNVGEKVIISSQIPQNNAAVAGIQKYNVPPYSNGIPVPLLSARSVLIKDLGTDTILYEYNAYTPLPIASTTKIMTALISNQYFKPNSELTVNEAVGVGGARVGLQKGEILTFRSLLYGMLLNSGNDAAYAIAENYPEGITGFVAAMNSKVSELGLNNTHFDNPAGFDSQHHYSSAYDLAKITQEALKDAQLAKIFATKETEVVSLDKKHVHQLSNLNKLLTSVSGVLGVKTGFTELAKENLVTLVERDKHRVLVVVLGSDDRFGESTQLVEWAYANFSWQD